MPVRANAPLALEREPLLARTTRQMLRFRGFVLAFWIAVLIAGGAASTR